MTSLPFLWVMRVYIVWVKGKQVTLKNPSSRESRGYLAGRPYLQDTCKIDSLARLFSFQSCSSHVPFSREPFSWTSHKLVAKCTDLQLSLSLYQLNTKPNTIKSHKIQETKLKQLQHFLSWNKANINIVVNHNFTKPFKHLYSKLIHTLTCI